jgi:hypothetical protein
MSFSKTVSVVAALGSIFSVGLASWKISEDIKNSQTAPLEQKIQELEKKLEEPKEQPITTIPAPVNLPQPTVQTVTQPSQPPTPPPPVPSNP